MKTILPDELQKQLEQGDILLIDVREPSEHRAMSIEGAHLIPLSELSEEKLPYADRPIVIHCQSGRRSEAACKKLLEQNPRLNVYTLAGGISAWKDQGCSVATSGTRCIALERQVQVTAGLLILTGFIGGIFLTPVFFGLCGFIGAGLTFAGLSGWCGMAKLLALMPWNR